MRSIDRGVPKAKPEGAMPFCLADAPLAVWNIQHLSMRLLEWKPQKAFIGCTLRPRAVFVQLEACYIAWDRIARPEGSKTALCRIRQPRDVLYSATLFCVAFYGVVWILAVIV